jgi:hypothetical protein
VADLIEARRERISSLVDSYNSFEGLLHKSSKAMEFYEKLNSNITKLQKKIETAVNENEREKDAVMAKFAGPSSTGTLVKTRSY